MYNLSMYNFLLKLIITILTATKPCITLKSENAPNHRFSADEMDDEESGICQRALLKYRKLNNYLSRECANGLLINNEKCPLYCQCNDQTVECLYPSLFEEPIPLKLMTSSFNKKYTQQNAFPLKNTALSLLYNKSYIIPVTIVIDADFDTFIMEHLMETQNYLKYEIAYKYQFSPQFITGLNIKRGSVMIHFNISNKVVRNQLNNNITLTNLYGKEYLVKETYTGTPIETSADDDSLHYSSTNDDSSIDDSSIDDSSEDSSEMTDASETITHITPSESTSIDSDETENDSESKTEMHYSTETATISMTNTVTNSEIETDLSLVSDTRSEITDVTDVTHKSTQSQSYESPSKSTPDEVISDTTEGPNFESTGHEETSKSGTSESDSTESSAETSHSKESTMEESDKSESITYPLSSVEHSTGTMHKTNSEDTTSSSELLSSSPAPDDGNNQVKEIDIILHIEGNYKTSVGNDKEKFLRHIKLQLSKLLRIPLICIIRLDAKSGSIIVTFVLISSSNANFHVNDDGLINAKNELSRKINANEAFVTDLSDNRLKIISIKTDNTNTKIGMKEESGHHSDSMYLIIGLSVGTIIAMIVIIIVTACAVRAYMYKKYHRQINPIQPHHGSIFHIPSRNDEIHSPSPEIKREGASSLGQYSYDSGIWVGTGPEPISSDVPEPPFYLPPNETEISLASRPPLEPIKHIKKEFRIDNQPFGEISKDFVKS